MKPLKSCMNTAVKWLGGIVLPYFEDMCMHEIYHVVFKGFSILFAFHMC